MTTPGYRRVSASNRVPFLSSGPESLAGTHQTRGGGAPGLQRRYRPRPLNLDPGPPGGRHRTRVLLSTGAGSPSAVTPNLYRLVQPSHDPAPAVPPPSGHAQTSTNLPSPPTGALAGAVPPLSQAGLALESPQEGHQGNGLRPPKVPDPPPTQADPPPPSLGLGLVPQGLRPRTDPRPPPSSRAPASWTRSR